MLKNYLIGQNLTSYRKRSKNNACVYVAIGYDKRVGKVIKIGKFEKNFSKRFLNNDYKTNYTNLEVKAILEFDSKEEATKFELYNLYKMIGKAKHFPNDRFAYKHMDLKFYYSERNWLSVSI